MAQIGTPLKVPELFLSPEPEGGIKLSDDMQQVLSLLAGFWRNKRVLLKASPTGNLFTASPRIKDVVHFTAVGANDTQQGSDVECTEVLVMGHPDNTGKVWVTPDETATTDNAWPLEAGDVIGLTIENMRQLNLLIETDTEKAIVAYSI